MNLAIAPSIEDHYNDELMDTVSVRPVNNSKSYHKHKGLTESTISNTELQLQLSALLGLINRQIILQFVVRLIRLFFDIISSVTLIFNNSNLAEIIRSAKSIAFSSDLMVSRLKLVNFTFLSHI